MKRTEASLPARTVAGMTWSSQKQLEVGFPDPRTRRKWIILSRENKGVKESVLT